MAELDKIPQTQKIEIATVKLDEDVVTNIKDYNDKSTLIINDFGSIYMRKREILARVKAWFNVICNASSKYLGEIYDITGDGQKTWDQFSY